MTENIFEITDWLKNEINREFLLNEPTQEAITLMNRGLNYLDCVRIASKIETTSVWWANNTLCELYDNSANAYVSMSNFLDTKFYFTRILITAIDNPNAGARVWASELQKIFFLLITFNRHDQALWVGGRAYLGDTPERFSGRKDEVWSLREVTEWEALGGDVHGLGSIVAKLRRLIPGQREKECSAGKLDDDPMFPYWEEKPLCGYMLRLWLVMSGQIKPEEVPHGHPECGVYEGLFANWNQPVALEQSIKEACDYHVCRSTEDGDGGYDVPEFSFRPYNVIPFEILAYRNVRRKMGLDTPWPAHPLLDSPFVKNLPEELPPSDDPLLNEVLTAVRKVLPEV